MPSTILDCDKTVDAGGDVDFHVRIYMPDPQGNARVIFSSAAEPEVTGTDTAPMGSDDSLDSSTFTNNGQDYTASLSPKSGTWEGVNDCDDIDAVANLVVEGQGGAPEAPDEEQEEGS